MRHLFVIILLVVFLLTAGCGNKSQDTSVTPVKTITKTPAPTPTKAEKTTKTTVTKIETTVPTPVVTVQANLTDGFWCRATTMNLGKAPTDVTECYQFFEDGTYKWGHSPGQPMGKSPSCSGAPNEKCRYSFNGFGKVAVEGGYSYTLTGVNLIDPHNPPYFVWTATGIP